MNTAGSIGGRVPIPPNRPEGTSRRLRLPAEAAGLRLDKALADAVAKEIPGASRTTVAAWIEEARVLVDGVPRPGKTRVAGGEEVEIVVPPPRPTTLEPEALALTVLHEDDTVLVIDKPAGLTVHPGSGRRGGTLANALVARLRDLPVAGGSDRPGIVHRLDKDTSGVLVVAKTEAAHKALSAAFAARTVGKEYLACVHGEVRGERGTVDLRIARSPIHRTRMATVETGGREARTEWSVLRRLSRHTLLSCRPFTGRTHQIRVHLAALHHPIVGDPIYGWGSAPGDALPGRMMLHAHRLSFPHPATGKTDEFEAAVPADFAAGVEALAGLEAPRGRRGRGTRP
jgi:23S rRNA pseudouridine1911/1915/1917 synthase